MLNMLTTSPYTSVRNTSVLRKRERYKITLCWTTNLRWVLEADVHSIKGRTTLLRIFKRYGLVHVLTELLYLENVFVGVVKQFSVDKNRKYNPIIYPVVRVFTGTSCNTKGG